MSKWIDEKIASMLKLIPVLFHFNYFNNNLYKYTYLSFD